ncbi:MAG: nuclear transport factor 2 family protein [Ilumatobacter sp.]
MARVSHHDLTFVIDGASPRPAAMNRALDIAQRFLSAFDGDDPDEIAMLLAPGVTHEHNTLLGADCANRDEYIERLPTFLNRFRTRHYEILDLLSEPREGATEVVARYRFTATYGGIPIDLPGVMWLTVANERIVRRVDTFDSLLFLRQTGQVMPDDES